LSGWSPGFSRWGRLKNRLKPGLQPGPRSVFAYQNEPTLARENLLMVDLSWCGTGGVKFCVGNYKEYPMLRTFVCAVFSLILVAGLSLAGEKGKGKNAHQFKGKVAKIDAKQNTLTVTVKVKKETKDMEFKINDATQFVVVDGDNKQTLSSKDGLKNEKFKQGASVTVTADDDDRVAKIVQTGGGKKKKTDK
jgi:hypothetical protein